MLKTQYCKWKEDTDGVWHTDCGNMFVLNGGNPAENKMKYCCYCGKSLTEGIYKDRDKEK